MKKELGKFGVIVDDVNEVTTVNEEVIDYSSSVSTIVSKKYIKGIIREKKNFIILLDLNRSVERKDLCLKGWSKAHGDIEKKKY